MEVGETNYFLPVDLSVTATNQTELETNLQKGGYPLPSLIKLLEAAGNPLNLVYLDACRNNPFRGMGRALSGTRSWAKQPAKVDIYIGYSTAPSNLAWDGDGKPNSPFATAFAEAVLLPNQSFEDAYKSVTSAVLQETNNTQQPWSSGTMTKKFVFYPISQQTDAPPAPAKVDDAPIVVTPAPATAPAAARQAFEPEMVFVEGGIVKRKGQAPSDTAIVYENSIDDFYINGSCIITNFQFLSWN
jgi:uncharacterized caspase-like protein